MIVPWGNVFDPPLLSISVLLLKPPYHSIRYIGVRGLPGRWVWKFISIGVFFVPPELDILLVCKEKYNGFYFCFFFFFFCLVELMKGEKRSWKVHLCWHIEISNGIGLQVYQFMEIFLSRDCLSSFKLLCWFPWFIIWPIY